jgi:hypothetical protein
VEFLSRKLSMRKLFRKLRTALAIDINPSSSAKNKGKKKTSPFFSSTSCSVTAEK